jgi:hypothetical protein
VGWAVLFYGGFSIFLIYTALTAPGSLA